MKKEREEIIKKMYEDIMQIPGYINGCGSASATIESYIAAAKDLQQAHDYEVMILENIYQCEKYEQILKLPESDKADFRFMRDECKKRYKRSSKLLHEFIEERKAQNWR